jgi:uncharacterized protein (TIGR00255 family)
MINSMTGFGAAAIEVDGMAYTVEIKTVNNRHVKAQLKMPDVAGFLADEVEKTIRAGLRRGTVNYLLRLQNVSGQALFDIDEPTLVGYVTKLKQIAEKTGIDSSINLAELASLPGIVQPVAPDEAMTKKIRSAVLEITLKAIENLQTSRSVEGQALATDLKGNCKVIEEKLKVVAKRTSIVVGEYQDKLKKRVDNLLAAAKLELDSEILSREVAIFADRSDIAEEITRLASHLEQFEKCLTDEPYAGRRLDFICQEMLREANTIASKASDALICQCVIDIKCSIDRIKEQVQNVE